MYVPSCKNIMLLLLQKLILLSVEVRCGWWRRFRSSCLWWRSCKGVGKSGWWWILNKTSNASSCRLSVWRKEEIMPLVFVCAPNLECRRENDCKGQNWRYGWCVYLYNKKSRWLMLSIKNQNDSQKSHQSHQIFWSTKGKKTRLKQVTTYVYQDVLRLTSELFNISRTLVQWAPSVANACKTWFSVRWKFVSNK